MEEMLIGIIGIILIPIVLIALAPPVLALVLVINLRYKVARLEEKIDLLQRRIALSDHDFSGPDDSPGWRAPVSAEYPEPLAPRIR
jgi:hypothetical protein